MAVKQLKSIKFPGLDDTYVIPDSGSIDIDLDVSNEGEANPVNADTLGGILASDYATESYVRNKIAEAQFGGGSGVDLSDYATKDEIPTKMSQLVNDKGYLTEHQSLIDYAKKSDIPDISAFQTAEQVSTLINEALGVIENGSY